MIVGVILSAGESRRMGEPKALLPIEGVSFIERVVAAFQASKVGSIFVVLGYRAEEMQAEISHLPVTVVVNRDYRKGQLSSLNVAIRTLEGAQSGEAVDGILVHLVDHPFISAGLVNHMIDRFYETKKLIVVPRFKGKRGHPVLFSRALFQELLCAPLEQGAKAVVHAHGEETLTIDTDDPGVTIDIDTPEDYRDYVGRK